MKELFADEDLRSEIFSHTILVHPPEQGFLYFGAPLFRTANLLTRFMRGEVDGNIWNFPLPVALGRRTASLAAHDPRALVTRAGLVEYMAAAVPAAEHMFCTLKPNEALHSEHRDCRFMEALLVQVREDAQSETALWDEDSSAMAGLKLPEGRSVTRWMRVAGWVITDATELGRRVSSEYAALRSLVLHAELAMEPASGNHGFKVGAW